MAGRSEARNISSPTTDGQAGNGGPGEGKAEDARQALSAGDWAGARAICIALLESNPAPPGIVLEQLAISEFMLGSFDQVGIVAERAYAAYIAEGDELAAVRSATHLVSLRELLGDWPAARGWDRRGWRLLEELGPCLERGYHALALVGCNVHDPRVLSERADLALGIARAFKDHELELRALADKGLALISQGGVDEGFALLDEVMVAVEAGEIQNPELLVPTICALMSACERTGDRARAEAWGGIVEKDPRLQIGGATTAHCQIAYGVVDSMRGRWRSAEERLLQAMAVESTGRYQKSISRARMAELCIQQGRYQEAGDLLRGYEEDFDIAPVLASLFIVQGDLKNAAGLLRSYTRGLGGDCMRLAPALAALVDLELKREDLPAANRAARRLLSLEEDCSSNEIRAMARLASARIDAHKGNYERALDELDTALTLLMHRDRPLLAAQIRLELARVLAGAGELTSAELEAEAALAAFGRLGAAPDVAAGTEFLEILRGSSVLAVREGGATEDLPSAAFSEKLTRREAEVARVVAEGHTNREIAARLCLSVRTVESHVDRVLGKLDFHSRSQLAAWVARGELAKVK